MSRERDIEIERQIQSQWTRRERKEKRSERTFEIWGWLFFQGTSKADKCGINPSATITWLFISKANFGTSVPPLVSPLTNTARSSGRSLVRRQAQIPAVIPATKDESWTPPENSKRINLWTKCEDIAETSTSGATHAREHALWSHGDCMIVQLIF